MRGIVLFLAYVLSLALIAVAYGAQGATVPIPTPSPLVEDAAFAAFLTDFRGQALKAGIAGETYDAAVFGIKRKQGRNTH